ncbi:hypothetical protein HCH05_15705 [Enterococcus raffinosus]|uniref:hypothetical protein n=1 Tax=Enterococcus raffinosus TaxID=71452 RepID=UPI001C8BC0B6|nr:hypothetical protein [Enterococcus raffinosus]MBX9038498.1 hypothetical protein [Enterococcus raffinosus]
MYVMQLILENGILLKITGSQEDLVPLQEKIEKEPSSTKFVKLTDSLTVKPRTICAVEIFDVTEGEEKNAD